MLFNAELGGAWNKSCYIHINIKTRVLLYSDIYLQMFSFWSGSSASVSAGTFIQTIRCQVASGDAGWCWVMLGDGSLGQGGAGSPNQESKLRYISIWEGALPLRGAVAAVINKTPICSRAARRHQAPQSSPRLDAEHKSQIGNGEIRDAAGKTNPACNLVSLMWNHLQWGMKLNGSSCKYC